MSVSRLEDREIITKTVFGVAKYDKMINDPDAKKVRLYSKIVLEVGAEVKYHVHTGESESFYILKGTAEYSDNGEIITLHAGDYTNTLSGQGHGIKNIGADSLEFMALIIMD